MANQVHLKLSSPFRVRKEADVAKVLIPARRGDLLVLPDRAPTSVLLRDGVVKILDASGKTQEIFFIKGGVADIHDNILAISTEKVLEIHKVKLDEVKSKRAEVKMQEYQDFYDMIIKYMNTYKKDQ